MLNDKTTPKTTSNLNMDIEIDFFFQDVSIEDCKEVLQSLWEHQLHPKKNILTMEQVLEVVETTREITKFINGIITSYRDGEAECLKMNYHIKPLSDHHYIESELDSALFDFLAGERAPNFIARGAYQCKVISDMFYHIGGIIDGTHKIWIEYVKTQDALEAAENSIKLKYCQPVVYK
jgi:hypothetical protein